MDVERAINLVEEILHRPLTEFEQFILRGVWAGETYKNIIAKARKPNGEPYSEGHARTESGELWRQLTEALGEQVKKNTLKRVLERYEQQPGLISIAPVSPIGPYLNLQDAPDIPVFYGRTEELTTLKTWLLQDKCRLVALLGMGGIGKTTLAVKLVESLENQFEVVLWRSLLNATPLEEILTDWIKVLSGQQETQFPENLEAALARLRHYLQSRRCLLILDNVETIFSSGRFTGQYRPSYEAYGKLFEQIGGTAHQSCLLITSREKPKEIARLESKTRPVRSLALKGLTLIEGQQIFAEIGDFVASEADWIELMQRYNGNPLGLEVAAKFIAEFCAGKIPQFLQQGKLVLPDLLELLDANFERLSDEEQEIVYWLAINREPVAIADLQTDIFNPFTRDQISQSLQSLQRRWTLEPVGDRLTLQPVLMEYVTNRLNTQVVEEICSGKVKLLNRHPLLKAITKEYIRESQRRLIVQPVVEMAISRLGNQTRLESQLRQMLFSLRTGTNALPGYAAGNILNLLCFLQTDLRGYDFSHLAIWQAYLQDATLHHVNFTQAHFAKSVFTQTFGSVLSVAFSPDGAMMATANANGHINLWCVEDGQHLLTCRGHKSWIRRIAFSPDGTRIGSSSDDQTIKIWDVQSGACLLTIDGQGYIPRSVNFSPDGRMLASGGDDQIVRLWDAQSGHCLQEFKGHGNWVIAVVFRPDGKRLASTSVDQTIRIWDIERGECLHVLTGHYGWIVPAAFSPDGQRLVSGAFDQQVKIWDVESGTCLQTLSGHSGWIWTVGFSLDGRRIASAGIDQTLRIWDAESGVCLHALREHTQQIWGVAFHPDGQRLATASDDQTIRLWDINDGRCLAVIRGYGNWVRSVAFSPDSQSLISAHKDNTVRIWEIQTQKCARVLQGHAHSVLAVAYAPDGSKLASAGEDRTIRIWHVPHYSCQHVLGGHEAEVWALAFNSYGDRLVSGSFDRTVRIWDAHSGNCLQVLQGHQDRIGSVAMNPAGSLAASGSEDHTTRIWDVANGTCLHILGDHSNRVRAVAFSPDSQFLASGSLDGTIKLWDVFTGQCIKTLIGHESWILTVAFSPDGEYIVSSGCDQLVKLWSLQDDVCIKTLRGHKNWVWSVTYSPDGHMIASAGEDEMIKLWHSRTGENLATFQTERPYEGMVITGATGLTETQKITLQNLGAIDHPTPALPEISRLKLDSAYPTSQPDSLLSDSFSDYRDSSN
ncbi:hypothetical protein BST81_23900 [Leptolyngbya sp. 'hensonii']|uniref:WD40 domain-containing protein n=1 Tax=Leptolyngbya sp. 'hensonii' TaxID=1922337 RepID=UPI00094F567D|nr:NB-ARC domain-containing protein [Leptolyngbya sp. 'hensonii']OLP15872.1 hypothetical protein BST81_23900 [Leptolyngbya sp. 'hensonii']